MEHGPSTASGIARQIQAPQMTMHHQSSRQPQGLVPGIGKQGEGGFQRQLRLTADGGVHHPLRNGTHLDHQAAGPLLHQIAALERVFFVEIHRQTQAPLQPRRQGEIRGPAAVDHQRIAHGGRGAVQIEDHPTGVLALRPPGGQQIPCPAHLQLLVGGILQQRWQKGTIEIPVHIAKARADRLRIARGEGNGEPVRAQTLRSAAPALQQMHPVALIAVGASHHQHPGHGKRLVVHRLPAAPATPA